MSQIAILLYMQYFRTTKTHPFIDGCFIYSQATALFSLMTIKPSEENDFIGTARKGLIISNYIGVVFFYHN